MTKQPNRRTFLQQSATITLATLASGGLAARAAEPAPAATRRRQMTVDLVCGAIGVSAKPREAIDLAAKHGFESVQPDGSFLAGLSDDELSALKASMQSAGLVFGAAGLPMEFRRDEAKFEEGLQSLPKFAGGLQRAGVTRVSTWLLPCHDELTYRQNFRQHAERLRRVADLLKARGIRLGLEYVGPKTSWAGRRFPFIHTMAEMKELIAEIGTGNVGFLLDSWHWYHAGETPADVLSLKSSDVVAVDLNDAPPGVPKDQMPDNRRELPGATGVIDVGGFLSALNQIGYDGPVRAEPFNAALNKMPKDDACAATAAALKKTFALIR